MRSAILEIFSEDYILTAKAKGLSNFQILRDHALRNAMLPTVTVIALNLGFTVAGAIEIETVFSWPGLGKWLIESVVSHPDLQGLRRWTLATRDAHGLYRQFGWDNMQNPEKWMEILRPFPGESLH